MRTKQNNNLWLIALTLNKTKENIKMDNIIKKLTLSVMLSKIIHYQPNSSALLFILF